MSTPHLESFILGGFECSSHRSLDGRRLDLIDATAHDRFALQDYTRLSEFGIDTVRDGLRWHLIETEPYRYDFSSVTPQLNAANVTGIDVIWDLFHYGYPDDLDIFSDEFLTRFSSYAAAFASYHRKMIGRPPSVVPINEISFYSWIGGEVGQFHPFEIKRGDELKLQLVRATIEAIKAIREVEPDAFIMSSEPAVNVIARPEEPWLVEEAEAYSRSQYQAVDMLMGLLHPRLGGEASLLDLIGINYYPHNQWFYPDREMLPVESPLYRPLNEILAEIYQRYDTPIVISETGTEDEGRAPWFRYVMSEARGAIGAGVDLRGICIYPIVNHPGWADERHCHNGLWDYADECGAREVFEPFAREVRNSIYKKSAFRAAA
jgi:beta-glucosidase/6-phospho-beta-glucosidase/beta-galactosidase